MCNCNCADIAIECECSSPSPIQGAELDVVFSTTFSGAPLNIYNSGVGTDTLIYTNTTSGNQYIIAHVNMYITSNTAHTLSSVFYQNSVPTVLTAGGTQTYISAPVKTTLNHILPRLVTLTPGSTLSIHVTSSDSTARMNWLTAFIYKYQY